MLQQKLMTMPHKRIGVAVIVNDGKVLIDRRLPRGEMANLWEFPGGKIEAGETAEECIVREIQEELGVVVRVNRFLTEITHSYPSFVVTLYVYLCEIVTGTPQPLQCAEIAWVRVPQLHEFEFPPANLPIICLLQKQFS